MLEKMIQPHEMSFRLVLYTSLILTLERSGIPQVAGILRNTTCSPLFLGRRHLNHKRERADIVSKTSPFPGSDFKGVPLPNSVLAKEQKYPEGSYTHLKLTLMTGLRNLLNHVTSSYRDKIQSNFMKQHLKWNTLQVLLSRVAPSHSCDYSCHLQMRMTMTAMLLPGEKRGQVKQDRLVLKN